MLPSIFANCKRGGLMCGVGQGIEMHRVGMVGDQGLGFRVLKLNFWDLAVGRMFGRVWDRHISQEENFSVGKCIAQMCQTQWKVWQPSTCLKMEQLKIW